MPQFEALKNTPLRYAELHAGFDARGFEQDEHRLGYPIERTFYVGVGLNLNEVLFGSGSVPNFRTYKDTLPAWADLSRISAMGPRGDIQVTLLEGSDGPGVDLSRQMGVLLIGLRKEAGRERTPAHPPVVAVPGFAHHGQRYPRAPSEVHLVPFGSVTPPVASGAT